MLNKLKIKNKIILFFIVIYSVYLSIIITYNYTSNVKILKDAMKNRITENYYQLSNSISEDIRTDNVYEINQKINSLVGKNAEIVYIIVYDDEKNILGKNIQQLPNALLGFNNNNVGNFTDYRSSKGEILDYISNIDETNIGYIRIGFYTKSIYEKTYVEFIRILILNGVVFFILLIVAYYTSKMIEKPVKDLTNIADEIVTKGDYKNKVYKESYSKDFHILVDSINEMLESNRNNKKINNYLLNKIFLVQESERKLLSRELHDEVSQSLASLLFLLTNLIDKESDDKKKERLHIIKNEINQSLTNIRNIAVNLRPPTIEENGIVEAIKKYIEDYQELYNIKIEFNTNYRDLTNDNFNITIYRIIQECLSNIKKHAEASLIKIDFYMNKDYVVLIVSDNGRGLTEDRMEFARKEGRLGIFGIQERVLDFEGSFNLLNNDKFSTVIKCRFNISIVEARKNENIIG